MPVVRSWTKPLNVRIAYGPSNEERDKMERSLAEYISVTSTSHTSQFRASYT